MVQVGEVLKDIYREDFAAIGLDIDNPKDVALLAEGVELGVLNSKFEQAIARTLTDE